MADSVSQHSMLQDRDSTSSCCCKSARGQRPAVGAGGTWKRTPKPGLGPCRDPNPLCRKVSWDQAHTCQHGGMGQQVRNAQSHDTQSTAAASKRPYTLMCWHPPAFLEQQMGTETGVHPCAAMTAHA